MDTEWVSAIRRLDANRLIPHVGRAANMAGSVFGGSPRADVEVGGREVAPRRPRDLPRALFSQCVSSFLMEQWRRLSDLATGPRIVMLTLPDDRHEQAFIWPLRSWHRPGHG